MTIGRGRVIASWRDLIVPSARPKNIVSGQPSFLRGQRRNRFGLHFPAVMYGIRLLRPSLADILPFAVLWTTAQLDVVPLVPVLLPLHLGDPLLIDSTSDERCWTNRSGPQGRPTISTFWSVRILSLRRIFAIPVRPAQGVSPILRLSTAPSPRSCIPQTVPRTVRRHSRPRGRIWK